MSYQRFTEGDAYVIGTGGHDDPFFDCVSCDQPHVYRTYGEILEHLRTKHHDSAMAIQRLEEEAAVVGLEKTWLDHQRATEPKP